ncbi:uncharacterized protein [Dendrobates tinctorius]|uniref:uncharacterized protein isoform X3 n=1 Tax=Dendrobates tinctorius TaxID=92724 RepID=UPI003CCA5D40
MDMDRDKMVERILHLTLEILFRLTGEDYTVVKKTSSERCQDPESERCGRTLSPITGPPPQPLIHEDINDQKILELTYKMIELLTGEVPLRCQDVAVYFSVEEWEYLEGHKDVYKDVMMEVPQPLTSSDLSSKRTTPERCPGSLLPQDCKQEDPNVPQDHQGEDLTHINTTETYVRVVEWCKEEIPIYDYPVGPSATANMPPKRGDSRRRRQETSAPPAPQPQMERRDHGDHAEGSPPADDRRRLPIDAAATTGVETGQQEYTTTSGSPPSHRQRLTESQAEDELPEEEGRGGQTPGVGSQLSSQSGARPRGPRSASQGRRRQRGGGHQRPSQRAPNSDGEDGGIDVDHLIDLVRERKPLWNMADRRHADLIVTRRLWEEICSLLVDRWENLDARAQIQERERIVKRWRSVRDRFKKELNKEMRAPSESGGRRSKYKYARALSFLRATMVTRSTVSSSREPARLDPSEAIPEETATEGHFDRPGTSAPSHTLQPSVPSTSAGASWPPTLHEAAGEEIAFPLSHPSAPATSSTPAGTGRQQQRGQEKSYAPEFLHLNASFQNYLKVLSEQISTGFQQINSGILELKTLLQTMHSEARSSPNHTFFRSVVERMAALSPTQQMHVMHSCHGALQQVTSQPPPPTTVVPPPVPPPPPIPYQQPPHFQQPAPYQTPSPYHFSTTSSATPVPAQSSNPPPTTSSASHMSTHSLAFSTPSSLTVPSPPRSQSSLYTPSVEVSRSPSSSISTPHYTNL